MYDELTPESVVMAAAVLAAGPLILVPLGLRLVRHVEANDRTWSGIGWVSIVAVAALLFVGSLACERGPVAASLIAPWLILTSVLALRGAMGVWRLLRERPSDWPARLGTSVAQLYIVVGAIGALAWRGQWRPGGFSHDIILLTGIHFHYAGFVLPIVAGLVAGKSTSRAARFALLGVVIGIPLVGLGITFSPLIELVAAILLAASCLVIALEMARIAMRSDRPSVAMLLGIASMSLAIAMSLAAVYAVGHFLAAEWLTLPAMVATHGLTNAIGFSLCALVGWNLALRGARLPERRREQSAGKFPGETHARGS
jgi:hypothetical protein